MTAASQTSSVSTELAELIGRAVDEAGGWLPFDRFMALALYAPGLGYYANSSPKFGTMPGSGSDFVTAPEMSAYFGRALALQVAQALHASEADTVIEFGAGSGALAEELLDTLGAALRCYQIIDLSGVLRSRQRQRLARFGDRVQWLDALPEAIRGVVLGNEVLDAMPVQLLHFDGRQWFERGVTLDSRAAIHSGEAGGARDIGAHFAWRDRATAMRPPPGLAFVPGAVIEIHAQSHAWTATLARRLQRGVAILIDYGFPQAEYYHPQRHSGTLMCHRAHRADTDPLNDVGSKDITAHVDFSAIALAAQDGGCEVIGYTSQARFLINCGIGALLESATLPERVMAHRLIAEHEMGELFKVIAFARGCSFEPIGFAAGDRTHRL